MKNYSPRKYFLLIGISFVATSLLVILVHSVEGELDTPVSIYISSFLKDGFFHNLLFFGIFQIVLSLFLSVLEAKNAYELSDAEDFRLHYNGPVGELSYEERQKLLAEMDHVIAVLNSRIESDSENAWQWEIKLKSATFTRNRIFDGKDITPIELTNEEKKTLENESPLLTLNEYNQKSGTDSSTVSSIKEKMALYRKHRQEQV